MDGTPQLPEPENRHAGAKRTPGTNARRCSAALSEKGASEVRALFCAALRPRDGHPREAFSPHRIWRVRGPFGPLRLDHYYYYYCYYYYHYYCY